MTQERPGNEVTEARFSRSQVSQHRETSQAANERLMRRPGLMSGQLWMAPTEAAPFVDLAAMTVTTSQLQRGMFAAPAAEAVLHRPRPAGHYASQRGQAGRDTGQAGCSLSQLQTLAS